MHIKRLGTAEQPSCILYLPNAPQWEADTILNIPDLIAANGNHWRKIMTIFAKLQSPDENWREYRDKDLLREAELISFENKLINSPAAFHLIAGKATWERMGYNSDEFEVLDDNQRLYRKGRVFLTPYPDYRQFPNLLIEQLRTLLNRTTGD